MNNLKRLREITAILRSENGCPWDREQTHTSIIKDLIEETYELADALESSDVNAMKEELGDVLFQVMFHSRIAEENGNFSIEDVAQNISEKLVRRHPHVFSDKASDTTVAEVLENWEEIKKEEKKASGIRHQSFLDSVPDSFPGLLKAEKLQSRAAKTGFDWKEITDVESKLAEELEEFQVELRTYSKDKSPEAKIRMEEEFGDILFTLVNLARHSGISPEIAINKTNKKFRQRFYAMEKMAEQSGTELKKLSLQEQDLLWEKSKL